MQVIRSKGENLFSSQKNSCASFKVIIRCLIYQIQNKNEEMFRCWLQGMRCKSAHQLVVGLQSTQVVITLCPNLPEEYRHGGENGEYRCDASSVNKCHVYLYIPLFFCSWLDGKMVDINLHDMFFIWINSDSCLKFQVRIFYYIIGFYYICDPVKCNLYYIFRKSWHYCVLLGSFPNFWSSFRWLNLCRHYVELANFGRTDMTQFGRHWQKLPTINFHN